MTVESIHNWIYKLSTYDCKSNCSNMPGKPVELCILRNLNGGNEKKKFVRTVILTTNDLNRFWDWDFVVKFLLCTNYTGHIAAPCGFSQSGEKSSINHCRKFTWGMKHILEDWLNFTYLTSVLQYYGKWTHFSVLSEGLTFPPHRRAAPSVPTWLPLRLRKEE